MKDYYLTYSIFFIMELMAAVAGTFYLKKTGARDEIRMVVYLLWITLFVELLATYTLIAYVSDYKYLSFIKDTGFRSNYWLYNIYTILQIGIYIYYFRSKLNSRNIRLFLKFLICIFVISAVLNLLLSDVFFIAHSAYTFIFGSLLLIGTIGFYFLQILRSDKVLYFYNLLAFYIAAGVLIFFLCVTPMFIYSRYYLTANPDYIFLSRVILMVTNVIMYGMFTLGFIRCARGK